MSILDRLNLLIRSEIGDAVRPDRARSAMTEMESSLRDAKRQQAKLKAAEKQLIAQIREARAKVATWEERAVLALKNNQEDLAREALVMKNRAAREAESLRDKLDEQRAYIMDMERALEALTLKIQGARGRLSTTSHGKANTESAWDAEFQRRVGGHNREPVSTLGTSDDSVEGSTPRTERLFSEFDRMTDKIRGIEASVDAFEQLGDDDPLVDPKRRQLEKSFEKLENKARGEDGLAALKKKNDDLADLKRKFSE